MNRVNVRRKGSSLIRPGGAAGAPSPQGEGIGWMPRVLYDYTVCEGRAELEAALLKINEEGFVLVSVTQREDTYTVFFRRFYG